MYIFKEETLKKGGKIRQTRAVSPGKKSGGLPQGQAAENDLLHLRIGLLRIGDRIPGSRRIGDLI